MTTQTTAVRARHDTAVTVAIALVAATASALLAWRYGNGLEWVAYSIFVAALVPLVVIDLREHRLPREITYPAAVICALVLAATALLDDDPRRISTMMIGAIGYAGFLLAVSIVTRGGIGAGDVRLGLLLGAVLGYRSLERIWTGLLAGFLLGALIALILIAVGRMNRRDSIPFGPPLAVGALAIILLQTG